MGGRIAYGLASVVLLVCWLGLRFERDAFARYATQLPDGQPAIVYDPVSAGPDLAEPAERGLAPVVVLAHGFASSERTMSVLARHLARAGYAVIALDFRGHGANTRPFPVTTRGVSSGLIEDVAAAVLYARMQPGFDGENVALVGHSMGGHAVLAYAGREPGLAAVIGISGGIHLAGPYPPPNVLLLWASGDSRRRQLRLRRVGAELAGLERLVLDRTYGEPERGRAVRLSEVAGTDHMNVVYSAETARRVIRWLDFTLGRSGRPHVDPGFDRRLGWLGLGLVAAFLLLWGLVPAVVPPSSTAGSEAAGGVRRGLTALAVGLVGAALAVAGFDSASASGAFSFVPLVVGRDLVGFLALVGILAWLPLVGRPRAPLAGLRTPGSYLAALLLFAYAYVVVGGLLQPIWHAWPEWERLPACAVSALVCLPYFVATERMRGAGDGAAAWLPLAAKLLTLGVLFAGAAAGLLPPVLRLAAGVLAPIFLVLELFAHRIRRVGGEPGLAAIWQAACVGWLFGSSFPLQG